LDDDDHNLQTRHAPSTVDSGQPGHYALGLGIPFAPSNLPADKPVHGNNIIDNNTSPHPAKRQRSASPRYNSNPLHTSTPPLLYREDGKGSREDIDGSDSNESGDDDISSKRQKLSAPLGGMIALSGHNGRSRHSPSPISEDAKDDESERTSIDGNLASTARTTPVAFESASLTEPQLCPEVIDANQDWEVRKIIGREDVDGVLHYLVEWCPTLEPEHSLGHAKELVDKFEARLRAQRGAKSGRGRPGLKVRQQAIGQANASGSQQQKRRQGRPRRQT
jgi:hypothetical protein